MSERLTLPDLLKGLAVILMVQVHLTELFIEESFINSQAGKISMFLGAVPAAPMFMVIMGFFLTLTSKPLSHDIKRGVRLIILAFLLNIGLNLHLFLKISFQSWAIDPLPYIFGVDILFLAGLSILLITVLLKIFPNNAMPFAILALFVSALSTVLPVYTGDSYLLRYPLGYIHSHDWWSYFPIIPWLAYPLAGAATGIWYKNYKQSLIRFLKKPLFLVIPLVVVIALRKFGFATSIDLFLYYHHGVRFFIWAIMLLLILIMIIQFFDKAISDRNIIKQYLIWTGKNVTAFYFIQWLIIGNLATKLYKSQTPLLLPVWIIVVLLLTSLGVFFWKKILKISK